MSFSKNDLELIKSKIILSQEIEKKTKVIKKGKDSWCCCPFHDEKTPSCKINDDLVLITVLDAELKEIYLQFIKSFIIFHSLKQ